MNTYFLGIAVTAFFKLCSPKHSNEMIVYIVQIKRNKYATKTDLSFDFFPATLFRMLKSYHRCLPFVV